MYVNIFVSVGIPETPNSHNKNLNIHTTRHFIPLTEI